MLPSTGSGQAGQALRGGDSRVVCGHIIRVAFESAAGAGFDSKVPDKLRSANPKRMSKRTGRRYLTSTGEGQKYRKEGNECRMEN